jgi:hypothetical protein
VKAWICFMIVIMFWWIKRSTQFRSGDVSNDVSCSNPCNAHKNTELTCGSSWQGGTAESQGRWWQVAGISTGFFSVWGMKSKACVCGDICKRCVTCCYIWLNGNQRTCQEKELYQWLQNFPCSWSFCGSRPIGNSSF